MLLLGHDGDANEWGVSGTIKQTAGADGQGWSFALSPGYGDDASDIQHLWQDGLRDANGNATGADTAADDARDYAARLDARIGYGISAGTAPGARQRHRPRPANAIHRNDPKQRQQPLPPRHPMETRQPPRPGSRRRTP